MEEGVYDLTNLSNFANEGVNISVNFEYLLTCARQLFKINRQRKRGLLMTMRCLNRVGIAIPLELKMILFKECGLWNKREHKFYKSDCETVLRDGMRRFCGPNPKYALHFFVNIITKADRNYIIKKKRVIMCDD